MNSPMDNTRLDVLGLILISLVMKHKCLIKKNWYQQIYKSEALSIHLFVGRVRTLANIRPDAFQDEIILTRALTKKRFGQF